MSRKRESYAQFTQQFLAQLDAHHGHQLSVEHEQRELRIRIMRFRLLYEQQTLRGLQQWPSEFNAAPVERLRQFKQQAVDREKTRERRQALARCIQRRYRAYTAAKLRVYSSSIRWTLMLLVRIKIYALRLKTRAVRRRRRRCTSLAAREEIELRSVSIGVPVDSPAVKVFSVQPPSLVIQAASLSLNRDDATRQLPPYELAVELLSARDIYRNLPTTTAVSFEADIRVQTQSKHEMFTWPKSAVFVPVMSDVIHWQDETLSVAVNSLETQPESVIDDWIINLQLQAHYEHDGLMNTKSLGRIMVPLSLLEAPLSMNYELCRWFPLEKAVPGEITRGEIRLRVRYLMRDMEDQVGTMVPHKPSCEPKPALNNTGVATRTALKMQRPAFIQSSGLQRRRSSDLSAHAMKATTSPRKATDRLDRRISKPLGPRPRAEVLSPPSSPSSVSSESSSPMRSQHRDSGRRRSSFRSSPSQNAIVNALEQEELEQDGAPTNTAPARAFLKRKPYKVVFRKLDWSKVAAKTDSKWNSQQIAVPPSSSTSNSLPTKASTSNFKLLQPAEETVHATSERLKLLSEAMYACCHVSPQTAAIAQIKYQSERKSYVRLTGPPTSSSVPSSVVADNSKEETSPSVVSALSSHAAMRALHKQLVHDSTGGIYASLLESLIEPSKQ